MKYVGSKGRHAKAILPIILRDRKPGQTYVEPFVGGANTLKHVEGPRLAGDMHELLISMWRAVSDGWNPPDVSRITETAYSEYRSMRKATALDMPSVGAAAECAFMGFSMSYGGKWFGGYRRSVEGDNPRNYAEESHRSATEEFPMLRGVDFVHASYDELDIPPESIIYCDPPYRGTLGYATGAFDHDKFWDWVREMGSRGHTVFVSEYSAPDDFKCVWQKGVKNTLDADTGAKGAVERLWVRKTIH